MKLNSRDEIGEMAAAMDYFAEDLQYVVIEGDLNHRGDSTKFSGEYAKVIDGFNHTLDAVIEPIKETSRSLKSLAQGDLNIIMQGDFLGQNGQIKEDMNQTIGFLKRYVDEITLTLKSMGEGNLDPATEIAQINQGVEQVSQVIQTNAATAEESAAASEELSGQAKILREMVEAFQLKAQCE